MPGAAGLICAPSLAGERAPIWDPRARGAIVGLTLDTTPADLARAVREGVTLSLLDLTERLQRAVGPLGALRATGGGLLDNAWARETADATGLTLEAAEHPGEAIGPATLAWAALGHALAPRIARVIAPDARRHARYRALLEIYRALQPALLEAGRALAKIAAPAGAATTGEEAA